VVLTLTFATARELREWHRRECDVRAELEEVMSAMGVQDRTVAAPAIVDLFRRSCAAVIIQVRGSLGVCERLV
jgi:hypothetical protein